jgi:hypothetical protein
MEVSRFCGDALAADIGGSKKRSDPGRDSERNRT